MNKEYITQSKKQELEKELDFLQTVERKRILAVLEYARGLGDLKENSEYHEARDEQGKLEDRIKKIDYILKHAEIIKTDMVFDSVQIGATVTIENLENGEKKIVTIVGPEDANVLEGKISNESPLGSVLLGNRPGDIVLFNAPKGSINYKIISIE